MLKNDFINKKIAVIGDVMLDEYIFGQVKRISPEAPVPVLSIEDKDYRVGGAANVAMNIAKMGNEVSLFGIIGEDNEGNLINKVNFKDIVVMGSIGCKIASILRGDSDIYICLSLTGENSPKDWDFAAPEAILKTAGGAITN